MSKLNYAIFILLFLICVPVAIVAIFFLSTPDAKPIQGCMTTEMNHVSLCPGSEDYVALDNISNELKNAILLSEDAAFYSHSGFDLHELEQSFKLNLLRRQFARGGSTITQQLAKNVFLSSTKSLGRKIREAYLAHQIEQLLPKDQIFERYLNVIEFGPNLFGIKHAAKFYFGKPPNELNLLEGAFLAFLLPNPKIYSQSHRSGNLTDFARHRILDISRRLERFKRINHEQFIAAEELVDRFPWVDLTEIEVQRLTQGIVDYNQPFPENATDPSWYEPIMEPMIQSIEDKSSPIDASEIQNEESEPADIIPSISPSISPEPQESPEPAEEETFEN